MQLPLRHLYVQHTGTSGSSAGSEISPQERERRASEAAWLAARDGALGAVAGCAAVAAMHLASRGKAWYKALPEPPVRIFYACVVVGAFSYPAHLAQVFYLEAMNRADMAQWERRDAQVHVKNVRERQESLRARAAAAAAAAAPAASPQAELK